MENKAKAIGDRMISFALQNDSRLVYIFHSCHVETVEALQHECFDQLSQGETSFIVLQL